MSFWYGVLGGIIIGLTSSVVDKLNKNKPFPVTLFYGIISFAIGCLVIIILTRVQ